jgi:hypothetical protein
MARTIVVYKACDSVGKWYRLVSRAGQHSVEWQRVSGSWCRQNVYGSDREFADTMWRLFCRRHRLNQK